MAKHLYLPVLVDANISEPERPGHWYGYDRKILLGIADGIVVDESARIRGVSSVPDPWARAIMFRAGIRPGSRHPLRRRLLQEWRGMLSVLALHSLHGYPVEIVPVALERRGRFADALRRLKPTSVELEQGTKYDWTDVLMVRLNGVTVGALSPATLVYTGADYAARLRDTGFPWLDADGFLQPPDTQDERVYLMKWLHGLKTRLNAGILFRSEENRDGPIIQDLNRLLNDWLGELAAATGVPENRAGEAEDVAVAAEPIEPAAQTRLLERYAVYRELLRPLQSAGTRDRRSELGLNVQRNRPDFSEVVVITSSLLMSDAKVWDTKRLVHLGGDVKTALERHFPGASGQIIDREDISRSRAIWIRPERYFFTDTLLAPREGSTFLGPDEGEMNAGRRFVMPFTREILDFFTPEYIRDELRPAFRETETEVLFSVSLPVGSRGLQRIERAYRKKGGAAGEAGVVQTADPPVLDLFPTYLGADWRRYYLFQAGGDEFQAVPVAGDPAYVSAVREHVQAESRVRVRITELTGDTVVENGVRTAAPFPEAVELVATSGHRPAGLILLTTGEEPSDYFRTWRVGVDFGTSNTNVYRKDSAAENAEKWKFHFPRYLRPLTTVADAVREPLLEQYFVPNRVVDLPIPSLLRIFQDTRREHLLLDYGIPFGWEYRLPPQVYTNLKWEDQDRRTEYFLQYLFFLLLVEASASRVRTFRLACSFPKAFSMNAESIFRLEVEKVLKSFLEGTGRLLGRGSEGAPRKTDVLTPSFEVEGVAAGEFFASPQTISDPKQLADRQIAAVMDVGGGTTDISIWSRNEIVFDASVQLAGRQISRLLQRNLPLLEKLFTEEAAAALYEKQNEPELFASRLNVVLRREEGRVSDMLLKHASHPDIVWLRRMLALEFSALVFFSAALIGAAARTEGGEDLLADVAETGIKLHWGGNAAKLIRWIDFGRYDPEGIAAKLLNAMLFNGLRDAGAEVRSAQLGQLQSPGHKSEAAGGLVVMQLDRVAASPRSGEKAKRDEMDFAASPPGEAEGTAPAPISYENAVVCGENVTLQDGELRFMDPVDDKSLFSGGRTSFRRTSLERLERFLEIFNHFGVRYGLLTDESRVRLEDHAQFIRDRTRSELIKAASMPDGQRSVEPIFISEVRLLMELLNADRR